MATSSKTKNKSSRAPVKKTISKKTATKKKVAKKITSTRKKAVPKKKAAAVKRKSVSKAIQNKPAKIARKNASVASAKKQKTKIISKPPVEITDANLPEGAETHSSINNNIPKGIAGMNKKDLQRAAARNYDNHHIHLSNRKGGIKPSGKKPLW